MTVARTISLRGADPFIATGTTIAMPPRPTSNSQPTAATVTPRFIRKSSPVSPRTPVMNDGTRRRPRFTMSTRTALLPGPVFGFRM